MNNILALVPKESPIEDPVAAERKVLTDALAEFDEAAAAGKPYTHTFVAMVRKYPDRENAGADKDDCLYHTHWKYSHHLDLFQIYGFIDLVKMDMHHTSYGT